MALTRDEVLHIAALARLGLSDDEVARLQGQLSAILDYFERLKSVDTEGLAPTSHSVPLVNVLREDEPHPSLSCEAVLGNAPRHEDGFIKVRKVLE